jgi:hypothetical protein
MPRSSASNFSLPRAQSSRTFSYRRPGMLRRLKNDGDVNSVSVRQCWRFVALEMVSA